MTVRALPKIRFQHPEVQQAYDALSQAMQEGNGERGDPKNRWLTVGDAFNGVMTTLILGGGDGSGKPGGANGLLPPGGGGGYTLVGPVIDGIIAEILKDPFFIFLGQRIELLSGPPDMTGSVNNLLQQASNALKEGQDLLSAALTQQGSSIATLQTTTDTQAQQITTLQTNVSGNSSAIVTLQRTTADQATSLTALGTRTSASESAIQTLNQTTATQATQISSLTTRAGNAESSITQLNQTTASQATALTNLTTRTSNAESSISNLLSTTPTSASWWQGLSTDVANSKSSISNLLSTTPTSAQWWSSLKTQVDNATSQIVNLQSTTPTSAQWWTQLSTTVNNNTAAIQQHGSTLYDPTNGLMAQYSVKIDNSGAVSGFGLASDSSLGSRFYIRADRFAIGSPGSGDSGSDANVPFIVQTGSGWWGGPGCYIKYAAIQDSSIDTAKIKELHAERIISGSIARTQSYYQSGTYTASGQSTLAESWGYQFNNSPYRPVLLRLEWEMLSALNLTYAHMDLWSVNGWSIGWDAYYKWGNQIQQRHLYSSAVFYVTVPANQFLWFNAYIAHSGDGGTSGAANFYITEQLL